MTDFDTTKTITVTDENGKPIDLTVGVDVVVTEGKDEKPAEVLPA